MKKKGKKSLALAMTLAVTVTSVPPVYAADAAHTPMILPELSDGENAKAVSWKYEKLDQAPMKESVQASSENTPEQYKEGPAKLAFDGDNTTAWHTVYSQNQAPYTIEWELGGTYNVGKLDYTRKADGANGTWKNIKVEAKKADGSWTEVCTKELAETEKGATTEITFEPVEATAMRVTITDSYNAEANSNYASAGEINVYKATKDITLVDPIKVVADKTTMKEGETQQLKYELTPEAEEAGGRVEWGTQDNDVLKVDADGKVTAVGEGTANASVNYILDNKKYNAYCEITVERVETECKINLNGTDYTANSLEEAVKAAGLTELTSVKFESGVIREEDFDFLKKFNRIQYTLKEFSIGDDVVLRGLAGNRIPVNAFYKNTSGYALNTVYLGKNVKGLESQAFAYCKELTSFVAPGLESMHDNALNRVNKLPELSLPSLKEAGAPLFGTMKNTVTTKVSLPSVTTLENDAFSELAALKELEFGATPPQVRISGKGLEFASGVAENLKLIIPDGALAAYKESPGYNAETNTWYGIKLEDAQEEVAINVTVNDKAVEGASLEKAVAASGVAVDAVTSLVINSGKVTQEDLAYLKNISRLETFEMNVGDNLQLIGKDGNPTTVLSPETAVVEFAPARSGSSRADIEKITLGGITEIQANGLEEHGAAVKISMPDVITVGADAFYDAGWLETLDLSNAETIGANAFNECGNLTTLTMNKVKTLGAGSFAYTDDLKKLTLPETIETIEDIQFGKCHNGNKSSAKITILATEPPTVDPKAFKNYNGGANEPTVTVPQGALAKYVAQVNPSADATKVLKRTDLNWKNLYLREEGSSLIEYNAKCGDWADQYAYVTTGETIPAEKMAALHKDDEKNLKENEEFKGWNTKKTGDGDMLTAETVVSKDMAVYPVIGEKAEEVNITATVNGGEAIGAESLAKVIEKATVDRVESLTINSGKVTPEDLETLKGLRYLETLEMNLDGDLTLVNEAGESTTVLPESLFEKSKLESVSLAGFTEIGEKAFKDTNNLTSVNIPNVTVIQVSAFSSTGLEEIVLPEVTTIGTMAFQNAEDLVTVDMPKVQTIEESAFYNAGVEEFTLPETIETIGSDAFDGGRRTLDIIIKRQTPPEAKGAFGKGQITVPDGALQNYLPGLDLSKPFWSTGDMKWNNLNVKDNAQRFITFKPNNGTADSSMYAYVVTGTEITEGRFPTTFENDGKILSGWNTAEDGSGTAVDATTVVTEDMTLYAQWSDPVAEVNITATVNGGEAIGAENLAKVIEKAGVDRVESLTIDSGKVTPEDLETLKGLRYLETLEMNLDGDLTLVNEAGESTTVLPESLFEKSKLESVSLAGFTEIGEKAFKDTNNLTSVNIPNVTMIQVSAFSSTGLEEIALPEVTTIGTMAFQNAEDLVTVDMPKVQTIEESAFYNAGVEEFTLPETIETIGSDAFDGGRRTLDIIIKRQTPPEAKGAFGKGQITVPDGALQNYLPGLDLSKPFWSTGDMKWNNLNVKDNAQRFITFKPNNGTADSPMYAYVVAGTEITEGRFPTTFKNGDKVLSGWNTAEDGSGTAVDASTVVTEDMTLYAQWSDPAADLDVTVSYSNVNESGEVAWTNQDVTVTLTANEPVQPLDGWTLDETNTVLTKVHDKNGTYKVTVTSVDGQQKEVEYTVSGIDKKAPSVKVYGTGNGEHYREITAIAIHDTEGISYLMINDTKTEINDKYKYFTDIKALGVVEGTNTAIVVDYAGNETKITFGYDKTAPTFQWIVDNNTQAQSKEVRLETSEEIQLPDPEWKLKGEVNGKFVYVKTFHANWKDKNFTVTDLAGNVSDPQFVEVKRIDNSKPTVTELTQDITDWTKKDVTVTIKTSTDCQTPEGWKKVNKRTFTKVFSENGDYSVTLTSVTGVTGDAYPFSITNIDKEAPVIDYKAIEAANGYKREIPVNESEEYTEEQLVEMFTKPKWVTDNSGHAEFKVDKWGLEHGLDGYKPFTSKTPGTYKVRFYAYDAAGNSSTFDVYVKVLEPETPEERTTTVNYAVFLDNGVRSGTWTHTGTEEGTFEFEVSMTGLDLEGYEFAEGETGSRTLTYGETTMVTFYLVSK